MKWAYKNTQGRVMFYMVRVNNADGSKYFHPLSKINGRWEKRIPKAITARPLYRVNELRRGFPVLLTEGEKACDAAHTMYGDKYDCLSWSNGARSWSKTDFKPIYNKKVIMWADSDAPGITCAKELGEHLRKNGCRDYTYIYNNRRNDGWDAYDAMVDGVHMDTLKTQRIYTKTEIDKMPIILSEKEKLYGKPLKKQQYHIPGPKQKPTKDVLPIQIAKARPIENLAEFHKVQHRAKTIKACCPFPDHEDSTPSFVINTEKNTYTCYGCGKYGDSIQFMQDLHGISFIDAVRKLQ